MDKNHCIGTSVKKSTDVPYPLPKAITDLFHQQFVDRRLPPLDQLRKK